MAARPPFTPLTMAQDDTDSFLASQYEAYPYPERDPRDEAKRLFIGSPSHLREIDYWVFGGTRSPDKPLSVLIAGCGTGDAAIMLATQMQRDGRPGSIIALDRSEKALSIAKARADARQLQNISFIEGSLLELPALGLSEFDYIDCCGVLHHLPDPEKALRGLSGALASGGGMGIMVYAPHGRTGVYMLQDALALLAPVQEPPAERLNVARRVMRNLPATAWLRQNNNFGDHLTGGDAGLYDLLLNPRDRAYNVTDFYALLDSAALEVTCLLEPVRYDPAILMPDPNLRARIAGLPDRLRAALAESLAGNMATHVAYVVKNGQRPRRADPADMNNIPVMREIPGTELARQMTADHQLRFALGTLDVMLPLPPQARGILPLIDGIRSTGQIAALLENRGVSSERFSKIWLEMFTTLERANRVLLRQGPER